MVSELFSPMDKFRKIMAHQESLFDQILAGIRAVRMQMQQTQPTLKINPFHAPAKAPHISPPIQSTFPTPAKASPISPSAIPPMITATISFHTYTEKDTNPIAPVKPSHHSKVTQPATPSNHTMNECHHTHGAIYSSCSMATDIEYSNITPTHFSTKVTPFEAVHGFIPPKLLAYIPCTTKVSTMEELLYDREDIFRNAYNVLPQSESVMYCRVIHKGLSRSKMEILVKCKVLLKKTVFTNVSRLYPCGQGYFRWGE